MQCFPLKFGLFSGVAGGFAATLLLAVCMGCERPYTFGPYGALLGLAGIWAEYRGSRRLEIGWRDWLLAISFASCALLLAVLETEFAAVPVPAAETLFEFGCWCAIVAFLWPAYRATPARERN